MQLAIQLGYAYNQILSVLTNTQLQQIFEKSPGFDLRHLLQGSEKFVDNILSMTDTDPSLIFAGVSFHLANDHAIYWFVCEVINVMLHTLGPFLR